MGIYENYWLPLELEDNPLELANALKAYRHKKGCCENADRVINEMKKERSN